MIRRPPRSTLFPTRRSSDLWELHRMAAVDRNVLRLAIYEMLHREDIPPVVSINEGVDIAKKFSTQRSEEHTSELQSQSNLVCRLLLEKKKQMQQSTPLTQIV